MSPDFPYASPVYGRAAVGLATFQRPNNTTAYAAGDVIGSATTANIELLNAGEAGSIMQVLSASVLINATAVPTGMTSLRLQLFDSAPAAIADNAPFAVPAADRGRYAGSIALPAVAVVGGGFVWSAVDFVGRPVRLLTTSLFCNLITDTAVTAVAALTEYRIRLHLAEVGP